MSRYVSRSRTAEGAIVPRGAWWVALTLMLLGLVVPLLLVEVPPLCDYPNHLARALFLAFGQTDPITSRMFAQRWEIAPNLALDLILPPMLHAMPPLIAGKMLLGLAAVAPATGAIALNYACFGRRSLWALAVGLVVYNVPFLLGFINFQLGIGVALWGAAAWLWLGSRKPVAGLVLGIGFGLAAFFCHLFAFAFYGVLIGGAEAAAIYQRGFVSAPNRRFAIFRAGAVAMALAPPLLLYLVSPLAGTGGPVLYHGSLMKLKTLAVPVVGYSPILTNIVLISLSVIFIALLIRRQLRIAPLVYLVLPILLVVFYVLPTGAKGVFYIDTRIPVLIGFLLFATTLPRVPSYSGAGILLILAALFVGGITVISRNWANAQRDIIEVRSVLAAVTPGSRVLTVEAPSGQRRRLGAPSRTVSSGYPSNFGHYGAFAFIDHRAFWSDAFTIRGQQPVMVLPPYNQSSNSGAFRMQDYRQLSFLGNPHPAMGPSYLEDWPSKFDYILVLNANDLANLNRFLPHELTLISRKGFAALFKVRRL